MNTLKELLLNNCIMDLFSGNDIARTILIFSLVIALGIPLGKIKVWGISLGITLVLFVGILFGQLGFEIDHKVAHFVKEFGLILFVFSIGMQVGPGFFSAFKKGGVTLNMLAVSYVFLGVGMTILFHFVTGIPMPTMVGVLSGAITNTPGLGAAQAAFNEVSSASVAAGITTQESVNALSASIPQGYASAYPLGVVGIILSLVLIRVLMRVKLEEETDALKATNPTTGKDSSEPRTIEISNSAIFNKTIVEISRLIDERFVISRLKRGEDDPIIPLGETILQKGDRILVIASKKDIDKIAIFLGTITEWIRDDWDKFKSTIERRRIIVTRPTMNGRPLGRLDVYKSMGVVFTRINRAGVFLLATSTLRLQLGDRVNVVGPAQALDEVEKILGNQLTRLREPNLVSIFFGIALGVLLGCIPLAIPGIPQPVKLGLAGGPLLVAILLSSFGYRTRLITYIPVSANLMLREVGILLFLTAVGLQAGNGFIENILSGGYWWVLIGLAITIVPILIIGTIARKIFKLNYYTIMGMVAGATTDPPALAYANATANNEAPAVAYATVYPLTMFLRVLTAQTLIIFFCV